LGVIKDPQRVWLEKKEGASAGLAKGTQAVKQVRGGVNRGRGWGEKVNYKKKDFELGLSVPVFKTNTRQKGKGPRTGEEKQKKTTGGKERVEVRGLLLNKYGRLVEWNKYS